MKKASLDFDGSCYRTMLRNDAYWFNRLGVFIERADNTARLLDVKYHLLLPSTEPVGGSLDYFQWVAILRAVSAATAYHWVYRARREALADRGPLISSRRCRARSSPATRASTAPLTAWRATTDAAESRKDRRARPMPRLERSSMAEIFQGGLHEFITAFIEITLGLSSQFPSNILFTETSRGGSRIRISHEMAHRYAPRGPVCSFRTCG